MTANLQRQLESLHAQLGQTRSIDPQSRELLVALLDDITRLLGDGTRPVDDERSVTDRLDQLAVQFEAEHPALGTALRQVVDTLAKAGI